MTSTTVVEMTQQALMLTLWLGAPLILGAALVGLVIGVFQALTQVQDQTLPYAFKAIVVFGLLALLGTWLGNRMLQYADKVLNTIAGIR
jgi:type III secretion protein S